MRSELYSTEIKLKQPGKMTIEWLHKIASKGGSVTGPTKRRGDADYYKRISALGVAARRAKKT